MDERRWRMDEEKGGRASELSNGEYRDGDSTDPQHAGWGLTDSEARRGKLRDEGRRSWEQVSRYVLHRGGFVWRDVG